MISKFEHSLAATQQEVARLSLCYVMLFVKVKAQHSWRTCLILVASVMKTHVYAKDAPRLVHRGAPSQFNIANIGSQKEIYGILNGVYMPLSSVRP